MENAMKYKVGDRVRISEEGKKEFIDHADNPYDGVGTVTGTGTFMDYKVTWDNGCSNAYDAVHLEKIFEQEKPAADLTLSVDIPTQAMKEFADHCERAAAALERIKDILA